MGTTHTRTPIDRRDAKSIASDTTKPGSVGDAATIEETSGPLGEILMHACDARAALELELEQLDDDDEQDQIRGDRLDCAMTSIERILDIVAKLSRAGVDPTAPIVNGAR